jgi:branched-chain amino acid transport system ATP-binding protein
MEFVLMVSIGGQGTLIGPNIGAFVITLLKNMVSVYTKRWLMILAFIYILSAKYAPEGFMGLLRRLKQRESGMNGNQSALECIHLTKRFDGLEAVKEVNINIDPGERRAIIGPNGAGKTTLFSLISGVYPVTSGSIRIFGQDITRLPSHRRTSLGLGRTFQITNLFPTLSVIENLVLASMGLKGIKFQMLRPLSTYRTLYEQANEVLERVGMSGKKLEVVKNLSYGEQRQIEISLALISNPGVLLLDEPTAGLSPADSAMMTEMIHSLDPKITILLIEHNMDVALQVASRITVLHQGCVFAEGSPGEIRSDLRVQEIYFGAED